MTITKKEYVKAEAELYGGDDIMVFADKQSYGELVKKYPTSKKAIDQFVKQKCKYYSKMDQDGMEHFGFEKGEKQEYIQQIADFILLVHPTYEEPKIKKSLKVAVASNVAKTSEPDEFINKDSQSEYEIKPLDRDVKDLKILKEIVDYYFPDLWKDLEGSLSNTAITSLKYMNGCPVLIKIGAPSGNKTTIDSFFYGHQETHLSDDFTPKAFVSHATNVKKEELSKIDLLPKLQNKTLITPELAPLFEAPKEKLIENFSMLTRVLDGEGLHRDSGVHGHRGYSGDYNFAWQGSSTPIRPHIWNMMGKLGNRMLFWNMHEKNHSQEDYLKMFSETEYSEKIKICRSAVRNFLDHYFENYKKRSVEWKKREEEAPIIKQIVKYAQLLAKLRGSLTAWRSKEEGADYEYTIPIIEEPMRAINSLRNLARGHALICDRVWLEESDLGVVKWACLSSMPYDRMKFFQLLQQHKGRLTTEILQKELLCSDETARKTMKIFQVLGVVQVKTLPVSSGRPMYYVEISPEFEDLITNTQGSNGLENNNPSDMRGVCDEKKGVCDNNIQGIDRLENNNPSENNPVYEKVDFSKSGIKETLEDG